VEFLIVGVLGLLGIAAASMLSERVGVAAPLLLVLIGFGVSVLPGMPPVEIDPEWILAGVLPPLLFSSAVSMPAMDFRREFGAIGGLSVLLVLLSTAAVGLVLAALVPGLGIAAGIALGAIVSPTDAVATSIVKRVGVTHRIVTVLEGESLLNDATALVLLRAAVAATAASVSIGGVLGQFVVAVGVAVVIGAVVGWLGLLVRSRVDQPAVNTVISFATPFVASVPSEALGGSGLVAAVVAGLVTGSGAIRHLSPQNRLSDTQNWRTMELVLEGAIFLVMGLELTAVFGSLRGDVGSTIGIAAVVLALTVVVRALYVTPLVAALGFNARRSGTLRTALAGLDERLDTGEPIVIRGHTQRVETPKRAERFRHRLRLKIADIDHFLAEPLGPKEGVVVVWAGMRGAVTLAAAQTLPETVSYRSLLVAIAFLVAAASLLLQGGTLAMLVRLLRPAQSERHEAETTELQDRLAAATRDVLDRHRGVPEIDAFRERLEQQTGPPDVVARTGLRLELIEAQRAALLAARSEGTFSSAALTSALDNLDADQISIEMRQNT
jgi:NhaP-type Na+/H+ or K+/H+ antiporter